MYDFFAIIDRMKYIGRWGLMRNTVSENIREHSHQVSVIAHGLATIENKRFGGDINADRVAVLAVYHDAPEVITGDLPTPIKYSSPAFRESFAVMEDRAKSILLDRLPEDLRPVYEDIFEENDSVEWKIVKAADNLSAYIKCLTELNAGNTEFRVAEKSIKAKLEKSELKSVAVFMNEFLPSYTKTIDENV